MTIRNLLSDSYFQQKKVLEKLVCHYIGITKEQLVTSYDQELTKEQYENIKAGYDAYTIDKKPLEFIMGYVEFFQRKFKVDERCLIPRPETEYMIEAVNEYIKAQDSSLSLSGGKAEESRKLHILIDVGTGCGVLGLSVLLENPTFFTTTILTEYFEDTFTLAKENYLSYQSQITTETHVIKCNLVEFLTWDLHTHPIAFPYILDNNITLIANLPYIPDETFDTQAEDNVKKREPRPAFVGGKDGLDYYREMFAQLFALQNTYRHPEAKPKDHVNNSNYGLLITNDSEKTLSITMFLEMMTWQVDILRQEFGEKIDFEEIKTFHFNIRIVKGTFKK